MSHGADGTSHPRLRKKSFGEQVRFCRAYSLNGTGCSLPQLFIRRSHSFDAGGSSGLLGRIEEVS